MENVENSKKNLNWDFALLLKIENPYLKQCMNIGLI